MVRRRHEDLERVLSLRRRQLRRHEAEAAGDAVDVRVDRQPRPAEAEEEHAGRRLRTDRRQRPQPFSRLHQRCLPEKVEVEAAAARLDLGQHRLQARRFRRRQATGTDRLLDRRDRRCQHRLPVGEALEQPREGAARVRVRRVLREQRQHQLAHRVAVRPPLRLAVEGLEPLDDRIRTKACAFCHRSSGPSLPDSAGGSMIDPPRAKGAPMTRDQVRLTSLASCAG